MRRDPRTTSELRKSISRRLRSTDYEKTMKRRFDNISRKSVLKRGLEKVRPNKPHISTFKKFKSYGLELIKKNELQKRRKSEARKYGIIERIAKSTVPIVKSSSKKNYKAREMLRSIDEDVTVIERDYKTEKLKYIDISESIVSKIENLPNLKELFFGTDEMKVLPNDLPKLEVLSGSYFSCKNLPLYPKLKQLILINGPVKSLPMFPKLKRLILHELPINHIRPYEELTELEVEDCKKIKFMPGFSKLEKLHWVNNGTHKISDNLPKLKYLVCDEETRTFVNVDSYPKLEKIKIVPS